MECDCLEHGGMESIAETECKCVGNRALLVLLFMGLPLRGRLATAASYGLLNKNPVTIG